MKDIIPWRKKDSSVERLGGKEDQVATLQRRMNSLFDDFFADFGGLLGESPFHIMRAAETPWFDSPNFEVSETEEEFRIKAELPGLDEKDIEVNVERDSVTIRGEKRREQEEKKRNYHFSEVSYGQFSRSFALPNGVDREKAQAQFKKGVLTLTLPKTEQAKTERKRIEIATD
ncbi:MAG: Hsp20/alpha crystallin family protein [bacterium]